MARHWRYNMKGVFDTLVNAFRLPDLRKKLLFTLFILGLYMVGGLIPCPGINRTEFTSVVQNWGQIGSLMDIIAGGGLYAATIFAMGITPYINSSIIIQLLTVAIPALENLAKEGEEGQKKIQKITRYLTVGLAVMQASFFCYATRSAMTNQLPKALTAALIGYLVYEGMISRLRNYFYIALFALGSVVFFNAADYVMNNVLQEHQRTRINVLLGLDNDIKKAGYNVHQSEIAIGSGGLMGKGFLNGTQTKLKYVPEQDTDFIFCTVGEEEGFLGCAVVLGLFLALILRLIHLAERQPFRFGRVYGYCVLSVFLFHLFINVGMVLGLTPVIGIPLPFFSYGGSSLWGFTILLFIFLRIDAGRNLVRT